MTGASELPPPRVAAEVYDERYYLSACNGYAEWTASDGSAEAGIYRNALARRPLGAEDLVVDVGCGRGELVALAAERGIRAIGVEYSDAAVALAHRTLEVRGTSARAKIVKGDARAIPVGDRCADYVTMLDVIEHLAPGELERALSEAHRILRPGGGIFLHTLPTRTLYEVTYRLQRGLSRHRRAAWPADPRNDYERLMHVNEQTLRSLRTSLRRAGFEHVSVAPGHWMHTEHVPDERARSLYWRLAKLPGLRRFGVADLLAEARRGT